MALNKYYFLSSSNDVYEKESEALPEQDLLGGRAIRSEDGSLTYLLHRNGGPAAIWSRQQDGKLTDEMWCWYGMLHRTDGPARTSKAEGSGFESHCLFDWEFSYEEWTKYKEFAKRVQAWMEKAQIGIGEFSPLCPDKTDEFVLFTSKGHFIRCAETQTIEVVSGPRDFRKIKTISLAHFSGGETWAAVGILATLLMGAKAIKSAQASKQKRHQLAVK